MPDFCNYESNSERTGRGRRGRARCFQFQSVSTEIHCRTRVRVGKAKRRHILAGTLMPCLRVFKGLRYRSGACANERMLYFGAILLLEFTSDG